MNIFQKTFPSTLHHWLKFKNELTVNFPKFSFFDILYELNSAFSTQGNILFCQFYSPHPPTAFECCHQVQKIAWISQRERELERGKSTFSLRCWLALKFISNPSLLLLLTAETHRTQNTLNKLYWDLNISDFIHIIPYCLVEGNEKCFPQSCSECQGS